MSDIAEQIQDIVTTEPVAVFIKGTPAFPACGNSMRALEALRSVGAPVAAVNILPDPRIRQELSELYGWPTIPQVFVGGELIGGADIVQELAESGDLSDVIGEKLGDGWQAPGHEKIVPLTL